MGNKIKTDWKFELNISNGWIERNERFIKAVEEYDKDVLDEFIEEAHEDIIRWKKRRMEAFTELGYIHKIKDKETA